MNQIARNVTMEGWGALQACRYLLHDRGIVGSTTTQILGDRAATSPQCGWLGKARR
jgi:hypothetical protein